jgi:lysozyme family protein
MTYATLTAANAARWQRAVLTKADAFAAAAQKLLAAKPRYAAVATVTGVPWFVIAVIHERESSGDFRGVLHNGEAIIGTGRKTTLVPKGRGPFSSWEDAAVDALTNCHPYAARNTDWSAGGTLTLLERYNGLGYFSRGLPSPYLWAGTDQYAKGKYVRDGVFDAGAVDKQPGCAGLLMALQQDDPTIRFAVASRSQIAPAVVATAAVAAGAAPVAASVLSWPPVAVVAGLALAAALIGWLIWRARRKG